MLQLNWQISYSEQKVGELKKGAVLEASLRTCDGATTSEMQGTKQKANVAQQDANAVKVN